MEIIYEFSVRLPLAKRFEPMKELEESINSHLSQDGYEQKLCITYSQTGTVKSEREMTESEIEIMKKILHDQCAESFGSATIEYFRRKSGNVLQSVS